LAISKLTPGEIEKFVEIVKQKEGFYDPRRKAGDHQMKTYWVATSLLAAFGWLGAVGAASASTAPVVLKGVLKSRTEYGPPGFGENPKIDGEVVIFVLRLRKPLTAKQLLLPDDVNAAGETFSEIQLSCDSVAFPQCQSLLKRSVGHQITASGQAMRATAPTDYLPVTLHVHLVTRP
jgi:hypothetical protein